MQPVLITSIFQLFLRMLPREKGKYRAAAANDLCYAHACIYILLTVKTRKLISHQKDSQTVLGRGEKNSHKQTFYSFTAPFLHLQTNKQIKHSSESVNNHLSETTNKKFKKLILLFPSSSHDSQSWLCKLGSASDDKWCSCK